MKRIWLVRALVVAALVAVVALGWLNRERGAVQPGHMAPAFAATTLGGDTVSVASLRGKVVLVNAWATWCVPCRDEMPALERLYRTYRSKGLVVLAVNQDEMPTIGGPTTGYLTGEVRGFVADMRLSFPVLLDPSNRLRDTYGYVGLPTTFLLDRDGRVVQKVLGAKEWDRPPYSTQVQALLDQ